MNNFLKTPYTQDVRPYCLKTFYPKLNSVIRICYVLFSWVEKTFCNFLFKNTYKMHCQCSFMKNIVKLCPYFELHLPAMLHLHLLLKRFLYMILTLHGWALGLWWYLQRKGWKEKTIPLKFYLTRIVSKIFIASFKD